MNMARVLSRVLLALFFACLAVGVVGVSVDTPLHEEAGALTSSATSLGWVCDVQPPTQYCGSAGVALTTPLPYPALSSCLPAGGPEGGSVVFIGDSVTRQALFDWLAEDVAGCATAELGGEGMDTCANLAAFGRKRGDYAVRVEGGGARVSAWPLPNPAAVAAAVSGGATFTFLSATFFRNVTGAPWLAPTLTTLAQAPPSSPSRLILSAGLWNMKYDETPTPTSPSLLKEEAQELVAAIGAAGVPWDRVMWRGLSATDPLPTSSSSSTTTPPPSQAVSQRYTPEAVAEARAWLSSLWAQAGAQVLEVSHMTACAPKGVSFPLCRAPPSAAGGGASSTPLLPLAGAPEEEEDGATAAALVPSLPHKKEEGRIKKGAFLAPSSNHHHHHHHHNNNIKHPITTTSHHHHVHSHLTVDGTHLPTGVSVGVMRATLHAMCGANAGSSSSGGGVGRRLEGSTPAAAATTPTTPPAAAATPAAAKPPPLGGRLYALCVISAFSCAAALLVLRAHRPNLEALLKTTPGAAAAYVVVLSAVYLCDVGKVFPIVDKDKAAGRSFDNMLVFFILVTLVAVGTVAPTQAAPPAQRGAGGGSGGGPNKPVTPERSASPAPLGGGGSGGSGGSGGGGESSGGALGAMESGAAGGGAGGSGAGAGATAQSGGGEGGGNSGSGSGSGGASSSSEGAGLLSNMDGGNNHASTAPSTATTISSSSAPSSSSSSSSHHNLSGAAGSVLSAASSAVGALSAALGVSTAPATSAALRGSPENGGFFPLPQSLEWKGWMMAFFLLYHYWDVKPAYPAIRVAVGAYLFLTGYGNFMSLSKKGPSLHKLAMSVLRINLFTASVMAVTGRGWVLYYIAPLHTLWTVVVYVYFWLPHPPPVKLAGIAGVILALYEVPGVAEYLFAPLFPLLAYCGVMKEWVFRSRLDAYAPLSGMLFAYATPRLAAWLDADAEPGTPLEPASPATLAAAPTAPGNAALPPWALAVAGYCGLLQPSTGALRWRVAGIGGGLALALAVHSRMYAMDRFEYNGVHRFTEWVPIFAFLTLRNLTPALRGLHLRLFAWLGEMSLELYILQFHVWMAGDAKKIVVLFPDFRGVSFLVATLGFVAMAWGASHATGLAMKRIEAAGETAVLGAAGALVAVMCIINALPSSCSAGGAGGR